MNVSRASKPRYIYLGSLKKKRNEVKSPPLQQTIVNNFTEETEFVSKTTPLFGAPLDDEVGLNYTKQLVS